MLAVAITSLFISFLPRSMAGRGSEAAEAQGERMKKKYVVAVAVAILAVSLFTAGSASASCYTYTRPPSAYTLSGAVSSTTVSCSTDPAWAFGTGTSSYAITSFTLGPNDPIANPNNWQIGSWVNFISPGGTPSDNFEIDVNVGHPNGTVSYYTDLYWSGAYGTIPCRGPIVKTFTANTGDTITAYVRATNSGTATIQITVPDIFNCP